jgi:hypothetical protein
MGTNGLTRDGITMPPVVSGWYMATTPSIPERFNDTLGLCHSLAQGKSNSWNKNRMNAGVPWMMDNGAFSNRFDKGIWIERLSGLVDYKSTCLFVVIPDVIYDHKETLKSFDKYRGFITEYPVAFVSQDGIQEGGIPWNDFDCLFIGGSDQHKLGKEGGWIMNAAKERNKWVHVGRVNSVSRILKFWRADSWDGTHLGYCPSDASKFRAAVLTARNMKDTKGLFDE